MSMGLLLGLIVQYYTFRNPSHPVPSSDIKPAEQKRLMKNDVDTAAIFAVLYWVTQLSAWFYPGTLPTDPEFGEGFPQLWLSLVLFGIVGAGRALERGRIDGLMEGKGRQL